MCFGRAARTHTEAAARTKPACAQMDSGVELLALGWMTGDPGGSTQPHTDTGLLVYVCVLEALVAGHAHVCGYHMRAFST
jgi:hypothetical protein